MSEHFKNVQQELHHTQVSLFCSSERKRREGKMDLGGGEKGRETGRGEGRWGRGRGGGVGGGRRPSLGHKMVK